ncbi:MAG: RnfH family protein [Legionellaceae bacterium]|nr:RnfH family protein [Legionellaceae bacterium]
MENKLSIEIVYLPEQGPAFYQTQDYPSGTSVAVALSQSLLYMQYPETQSLAVGIYGLPVDRSQLLKNHDRIEIYRPLQLDPKDRRRKNAKL